MTVVEGLMALDRTELSLDDIAEAIGTRRVSADEIDELFGWLELRGRVIDGRPSGPGAAALLGQVLEVARTLRVELGRTPQPREIGSRANMPLELVQRALWFARILQR
jgi:hypothetical protein